MTMMMKPQGPNASSMQTPQRGQSGSAKYAALTLGLLGLVSLVPLPVGAQTQTGVGTSLITRTFAASLTRSRDAAREAAKPIPDTVRRELEPFFPSEMLDTVRYTVGDTTPDGVAGFAMRNGNAIAVTLIDTIVFGNEAYVDNTALWAHELHHVEQYRDWGVEGFAERYAFNWASVEQDARNRAAEFVAWAKSKS